MSDLRNDEQVAEYLDTCRDRHAGYGFLVTLFEVVASSMEIATSSADATYSLTTWCRLCATKPISFQNKLDTLREAGVINTESVGNKLTIEIPKLHKLRDETSVKALRNSGIAPEPLRLEKRRGEENRKDKNREEEDPKLTIASMDFSLNRSRRPRSPEVDKGLGEKVDELLATARALFDDHNGELNIFKLARTINQHDGKKNVEPSPAFVKAVANCVKTYYRRSA